MSPAGVGFAVACIFCPLLAMTFVLARLYSKRIVTRTLGWDDGEKPVACTLMELMLISRPGTCVLALVRGHLGKRVSVRLLTMALARFDGLLCCWRATYVRCCLWSMRASNTGAVIGRGLGMNIWDLPERERSLLSWIGVGPLSPSSVDRERG